MSNAEQILSRLKNVGILPDDCGDVTITANLNLEPIGLWISYHCFTGNRAGDNKLIQALTKTELTEEQTKQITSF